MEKIARWTRNRFFVQRRCVADIIATVSSLFSEKTSRWPRTSDLNTVRIEYFFWLTNVNSLWTKLQRIGNTYERSSFGQAVGRRITLVQIQLSQFQRSENSSPIQYIPLQFRCDRIVGGGKIAPLKRVSSLLNRFLIIQSVLH